MNWKDYIHSDPKVMQGKPVIRGTRITVELILEKLAAGETNEDLLKSYPHITQESIKACLLYAAESVRTDITYPIAS